MALTGFQRTVCRLIADARRAGGESYIAGGGALNELIAAPRVSDDIDLFHDGLEAVATAWDRDRRLFEDAGLDVAVVRERPGYVEAVVSRGADRVLIQWTRDSAFRFFPLVEHDVLGLTLHPFDLATNKVLALVGRSEVRDWIDTLGCHDRIQPLGYLAWAACGKDPGFSPSSIIEEAARANRFSAGEVASLEFAGPPPDAARLSRQWQDALGEARAIIALLPAQAAGEAVLGQDGLLFRGTAADLRATPSGSLRFHRGRLRGAFPVVSSQS